MPLRHGLFRRAYDKFGELSPGDSDLPEYSLDNTNRPLSWDELLENTAHRECVPYHRGIDIRVARLRCKIEEVLAILQIIRTCAMLADFTDCRTRASGTQLNYPNFQLHPRNGA